MPLLYERVKHLIARDIHHYISVSAKDIPL